jgi:hypothetical protein
MTCKTRDYEAITLRLDKEEYEKNWGSTSVKGGIG